MSKIDNKVQEILQKINHYVFSCDKNLIEYPVVNNPGDDIIFENPWTYPEPLKGLTGQEFWDVVFRISNKIKVTIELRYQPPTDSGCLNITITDSKIDCNSIICPPQRILTGVRLEGWEMIGDILINNGIITPSQRDYILDYRNMHQLFVPEDKFGDWAVSCDFCDYEDIAKALYDQSGYEWPKWTQEQIDDITRRGRELYKRLIT